MTTKHWRAYHGYEETLTCLDLSLKRLNLPFVDLYLMHWPGTTTQCTLDYNNPPGFTWAWMWQTQVFNRLR